MRSPDWIDAQQKSVEEADGRRDYGASVDADWQLRGANQARS